MSTDPQSFEHLVEKGALLYFVPRRDVRKWAAYVDLEVALREHATRVSVIRWHLAALDAKSGTMAGIAGLLVAAFAFAGDHLNESGRFSEPWVVAVFGVSALLAVSSAAYAISTLGVEQPEDAGKKDKDAFEFRLLQRLVYRSRNHAWGLRSAQGSLLLAGGLFGLLN